MAEKINSYCSICGKGYKLCMSCKDDMELSPWKIHTDTSEHYKIYQILHAYSAKVLTKGEAKDKLEKVDLSDLKDLRQNIVEVIEEILNADKVNITEETVETIERNDEIIDTLVEDKETEKTENDVIATTISTQKAPRKRKSNK